MAVESKIIPIGTKAPSFKLKDTITGQDISLEKISSDIATVIMFLCNHCPYVKYINNTLALVAKEFQKLGMSFIGISSNDIDNYPEDSPEKMREVALEVGYSFPYLYDESQEVARAYDAACTPDIYVFDKELKLVYHGQFDDSRPANNIPVTGKDLRNVLDNIIAGKTIDKNQKPSIGCSIKWK